MPCQAYQTRPSGICVALHTQILSRTVLFFFLVADALDHRLPSCPSPCAAVQCTCGGRAPPQPPAGGAPHRASETRRAANGGRAPSRPALRMRGRPSSCDIGYIVGQRLWLPASSGPVLVATAPHLRGARQGACNPFWGHRDGCPRRTTAARDAGEAGARPRQPLGMGRQAAVALNRLVGGAGSGAVAHEGGRPRPRPRGAMARPLSLLFFLSPRLRDAPPHPSRVFGQTPQTKSRADGQLKTSDGCNASSLTGTRWRMGGLAIPSQRCPPTHEAARMHQPPAATCGRHAAGSHDKKSRAQNIGFAIPDIPDRMFPTTFSDTLRSVPERKSG